MLPQLPAACPHSQPGGQQRRGVPPATSCSAHHPAPSASLCTTKGGGGFTCGLLPSASLPREGKCVSQIPAEPPVTVLSAELAGTGSNGRAPSPWALHRRLLGDGGREGCPHPTHPEPNQGLLCPFPPDIGVERSTSWGLWGRCPHTCPTPKAVSPPQMCCWSQEPSWDSSCKHRGYSASLISSRG